MKSSGRSQPQRTCVVCRQKKLKHKLIRIVRNPGNTIEADLKNIKPGRGVYLCRSVVCFDLALKSNKLEYALKTQLSHENKKKLLIDLENIMSNSKNIKDVDETRSIS